MRSRTSILQLASGHSELAVHPELGGAIGYWTWRGTPIFHARAAAAEVDDMASFPMLPYANRIAHGRLSERIVLPAHPGEAHSLHGVGWKRPWRVLASDTRSVRMALRHAADRDWPFDFLAESSVTLGADALTHTLSLTNTGRGSMPAGLGLHPYFPVDECTTLHTRWSGMWGVTADHLPTSYSSVSAAGEAVAIGLHGWQVNNCFTGWSRQATLSYSGHCVEIAASPACGFVQCYRLGPQAAFVAIEPVTHRPNAGLRLLAPGQSMQIAMLLRARPA